MPQIGISVVKRVNFRLGVQEFANTYHYTSLTGALAAAEGLVDEIVAVEKQLHSTLVTFVRASVWTSGGNKAENEMIFQKSLSGTGAQPQNSNMDLERAVLIRWPAGKSSTGKPVYLRKWFHSCGSCAGVMFQAAALQNTAEIPGGDRGIIQAKAEELREVGNLETWTLCAESGRKNEGQAQVHRFLEHHQLGDQWRG